MERTHLQDDCRSNDTQLIFCSKTKQLNSLVSVFSKKDPQTKNFQRKEKKTDHDVNVKC